MSLSNEWEEVYLTPGGWVDGSYKHDFGDRKTIPKPEDAVLLVRRSVYIGAMGAKPQIQTDTTPLTSDKASIDELRKKYGDPSFGV